MEWGDVRPFDKQRYLRGRKDFWLYTTLILVYWMLSCLISTEGSGNELIVESILLLLMYKGYRWIWYFIVAREIYNFLRTIILGAVFVMQLYWMIYTYPLHIIISNALAIPVEVATCIILLLKKDLRYFIKMNHLKRRGELSPRILLELRDGKK